MTQCDHNHLHKIQDGEWECDNCPTVLRFVSADEPTACKHERQSTGLNEDGTTWIFCNVCNKMLFEGTPEFPARTT